MYVLTSFFYYKKYLFNIPYTTYLCSILLQMNGFIQLFKLIENNATYSIRKNKSLFNIWVNKS